jgi:ArsR family transcriptional regulator
MSEPTTPFGRRPLELDDAEHLAAALHAMADPARLQLLSLLWRHGGELSSLDLEAQLGRLTQSTISQHTAKLAKAGLITRRRAGSFVMHRLSRTGVAAVTRALRPVRGDQ